jgi:hypothetical protein
MQFVLTTMLIYLAVATDLPQCVPIKRLTNSKLSMERAQGSTWRSLSCGMGAQFAVGPTKLGSLAISNLRNLDWVLH